jgi:hypothetical protein
MLLQVEEPPSVLFARQRRGRLPPLLHHYNNVWHCTDQAVLLEARRETRQEQGDPRAYIKYTHVIPNYNGFI